MTLPFISGIRFLVLTGLPGVILSWTVFFQQPLLAQGVLVPEQRNTTPNLTPLSSAKEKIIAVVYKFRDLSNQSQSAKTSSLPSATPNYTGILIKMLETSGWFEVAEPNKIGDRLNEGKPASGSPSQPITGDNSHAVAATTIFLESGILSYDANTILDNEGHHYFSEHDAEQYSQDRVTVYLRAISAKSGKILKTTYSSKTILSQLVNDNTYRYVSFRQPLEAETGLTTTPPNQLAVIAALDKAVQGLIIEGVRDGLWSANNLSPLALRKVIDAYDQEEMGRSELESLDGGSQKNPVHARPRIDAPLISLHAYGGIMRYTGDYTQRETKGAYGLSVDMYLVPIVGLQVNAVTGTLASQDAFSVNLTSLEVNAVLRPMPYQYWTPIIYGGVGMVSRSGSGPLQLYGTKYGQVQGGLGVQFSPNSTFGFRSILSYNQPFTDSLDGLIMGSHKDYYMRFTLGLVIHMGRFPMKTNPIRFLQVTPK